MRAVPGVDEGLAGFELLFEGHRALDRLSVDEARIGARMRRAGRADRDDGAGADLAHAFAMGVAVDRFVGAQDRVAAAQQRDARRHAEAQALERREPRLGAPEFRRRRNRVGLMAGFVPSLAVAAAHGLDEAVACMGMAIDQAGHDDLAAGVDHRRSLMRRQDFFRGADCDDPVLLDGDGAVLDDPALRVHRHDDAVGDDDVGHAVHSGRSGGLGFAANAVEGWNERQQLLRVGMLRRVEEGLGIGLLQELSLPHHRDAVAHLAHHGEIVADEQQGQAGRVAQVLQQVQDLRLHRNVEGGCRLVADDQLRTRARAPARWRGAASGRPRTHAGSAGRHPLRARQLR